MVKSKFLLLALLILFISCNENKGDLFKTKEDTPKALKKSGESDISSFKSRGKSNLVSELYEEFLEKDPGLRKLEESMDEFKKGHQNYLNRFDEYDGKSREYYRDANSYGKAIKDSILSKKIEQLLLRNEEKYKQLISRHGSLQDELTMHSSTIEDRFVVLKILLTLEQIEKYQKDNLPDTKEASLLIKKGKMVSSKADSLTTKY